MPTPSRLQTAYGLDLTWIQMKKNSGFQPRRGLYSKRLMAGLLKFRSKTLQYIAFSYHPKVASVIVSVSFGHSRNSSFELNALKPCPAWMTPY
jgi:hypothetical protein